MSVKDQALAILLFLSVVVAASSCSPVVDVDDSGADGDVQSDGDSDSDADADFDTDGDSFVPDGGLDPRALTGLLPNHGPFSGGAEVLLRGRGFVEDAEVRFGERLVDPVDVTFLDDNRVRVVTPPGEPGTVDVTMSFPGGELLTLAEGYTYDP